MPCSSVLSFSASRQLSRRVSVQSGRGKDAVSNLHLTKIKRASRFTRKAEHPYPDLSESAQKIMLKEIYSTCVLHEPDSTQGDACILCYSEGMTELAERLQAAGVDPCDDGTFNHATHGGMPNSAARTVATTPGSCARRAC